jgi:hypothetical protein
VGVGGGGGRGVGWGCVRAGTLSCRHLNPKRRTPTPTLTPTLTSTPPPVAPEVLKKVSEGNEGRGGWLLGLGARGAAAKSKGRADEGQRG